MRRRRIAQDSPLIKLDNVGKNYRTLLGGGVRALESVSIDIAQGSVVGIAGPNGAGKSTLIALLLGLTKATEGSVSIGGMQPRSYVEKFGVGYLPELMTLPPHWRVEDALNRLAALSGIARSARRSVVERGIELVGIGEHRRKKLKTLSKGNFQRVGLAHAITAECALTVLDEPTHGLDPMWTAEFRDMVLRLRSSERTIIVASHNLDELERICDRVVIIDRGRIQKVVEVSRGEDLETTGRWRIAVAAGSEILTAVFGERGLGVESGDSYLEVATDVQSLNSCLAAAISAGALVRSVTPVGSSLERVFRSSVTRR